MQDEHRRAFDAFTYEIERIVLVPVTLNPKTLIERITSGQDLNEAAFSVKITEPDCKAEVLAKLKKVYDKNLEDMEYTIWEFGYDFERHDDPGRPTPVEEGPETLENSFSGLTYTFDFSIGKLFATYIMTCTDNMEVPTTFEYKEMPKETKWSIRVKHYLVKRKWTPQQKYEPLCKKSAEMQNIAALRTLFDRTNVLTAQEYRRKNIADVKKDEIEETVTSTTAKIGTAIQDYCRIDDFELIETKTERLTALRKAHGKLIHILVDARLKVMLILLIVSATHLKI